MSKLTHSKKSQYGETYDDLYMCTTSEIPEYEYPAICDNLRKEMRMHIKGIIENIIKTYSLDILFVNYRADLEPYINHWKEQPEHIDIFSSALETAIAYDYFPLSKISSYVQQHKILAKSGEASLPEEFFSKGISFLKNVHLQSRRRLYLNSVRKMITMLKDPRSLLGILETIEGITDGIKLVSLFLTSKFWTLQD